MLVKLGLSPDHLQCGIPLPSDEDQSARVTIGEIAPSPLQCDCSGKHTGMLATCLHRGLPTDSYLSLEHPIQQEILRVVSSILGIPEDVIHIAPDGCSVPTFGAPVAAFARAYAALADPATGAPDHREALDRLRSAMTSWPMNVGGTRAYVSQLMKRTQGRVVAKDGAEGLICLGIPEAGLGIAIRIADGSFRAHPVAVLATLEALDEVPKDLISIVREFLDTEVRNHNGWIVGELRATAQFTGYR
jgi:L-asparaginase II